MARVSGPWVGGVCLYSPRPSSASQWPILTCGGCAWWQRPVGGWGVQWPAPWGLDGLQGASLCVPGACSGREHWGDRERVAGEEAAWFPGRREQGGVGPWEKDWHSLGIREEGGWSPGPRGEDWRSLGLRAEWMGSWRCRAVEAPGIINGSWHGGQAPGLRSPPPPSLCSTT